MRPWMLLFPLMLTLGCSNYSKAERFAETYATDNFGGEEVQNIDCELRDSDDNGRVRCTVALRAPGETSNHTENIECPSRWIWQPFKQKCVGIKGGR